MKGKPYVNAHIVLLALNNDLENFFQKVLKFQKKSLRK